MRNAQGRQYGCRSVIVKHDGRWHLLSGGHFMLRPARSDAGYADAEAP